MMRFKFESRGVRTHASREICRGQNRGVAGGTPAKGVGAYLPANSAAGGVAPS